MSAHVETSVHESSATESSTRLTLAIQRARHALLASQHQDGYWCFELEADCTIPSEYVLLMHYMNTVRVDVQAKIAVYLRERELETGGWPLYAGGQFDMSCSVKTYYALKLAGDDPAAEHQRPQAHRETVHPGNSTGSEAPIRAARSNFPRGGGPRRNPQSRNSPR